MEDTVVHFHILSRSEIQPMYDDIHIVRTYSMYVQYVPWKLATKNTYYTYSKCITYNIMCLHAYSTYVHVQCVQMRRCWCMCVTMLLRVQALSPRAVDPAAKKKKLKRVKIDVPKEVKQALSIQEDRKTKLPVIPAAVVKLSQQIKVRTYSV